MAPSPVSSSDSGGGVFLRMAGWLRSITVWGLIYVSITGLFVSAIVLDRFWTLKTSYGTGAINTAGPTETFHRGAWDLTVDTFGTTDTGATLLTIYCYLSVAFLVLTTGGFLFTIAGHHDVDTAFPYFHFWQTILGIAITCLVSLLPQTFTVVEPVLSYNVNLASGTSMGITSKQMKTVAQKPSSTDWDDSTVIVWSGVAVMVLACILARLTIIDDSGIVKLKPKGK